MERKGIERGLLCLQHLRISRKSNDKVTLKKTTPRDTSTIKGKEIDGNSKKESVIGTF